MNQFVTCTIAADVTSYRFRITNTVTNAVHIITTGLNKFSFSQVPLPIRAFGTMYLVEVALRNTNGTYFPYAEGCNFTTMPFPTTKIRPLQCGVTASSYAEVFSAVIVSGATEYRFNLYNTALGYDKVLDNELGKITLNLFSVSLPLVSLVPSTAYSIKVAVKINGTWGPYGDVCTITTPAAKTNSNVSNEFTAIAYPNGKPHMGHALEIVQADANMSVDSVLATGQISNLLIWGLTNFSTISIAKENETFDNLDVWLGKKDKIKVHLKKDIYKKDSISVKIINSLVEISGFIKESILTNGPEIKLHSRLILESIIS